MLEIYLGVTFGAAGLTKIAQLGSFKVALSKQNILPAWSVQWVGLIAPWIEVTVAALLISGLAPIVAALLACGLCSIFLFFKLLLFSRKSTASCGCSGAKHHTPVDLSSITVSVILLGISLLYLAGSAYTVSANGAWRGITVLLGVTSGSYLLWKAILQRCVWNNMAK
jgi:hypothetical protein